MEGMTLILCALGIALAAALMYGLVRIAAARNKSAGESKQKSAFLANMSREMRTPLNAVIGLSELILEDEELSEDSYLKLVKIHNSGLTLLSTLNDILDISKIETGKFEIVPAEYDIPGLLNDVITQNMMHIGKRHITFIPDISEDLPTRLYGDEQRIKQMLNNLLSNAFKYTRDGSVELSIRCERGPGSDTVWLITRVSDTGIGIRSEDIPRLFTDYIHLDRRTNRKIEGTGLGLHITKKIAEMMGGSIRVESEYGKGSVFTIKIRQQLVSGETIGAEVVNSLKKIHYADQKRRRESRMTRISLPYAKVLVVDDVVINLDVARGMMKAYDMRIDCVESGQEAIALIRAGKVRYNAIFMDHLMPGMNGIEATRIIREEIGTEYAKNIPIIALTANAIAGNEEMFLSKGFQAFISKPVEIPRLDAVLRQWVRDKTLEDDVLFENNEYIIEEETRAKAFPFRIDGIDLQRGFERFRGDEESFLRVLRSYTANTPPLLTMIRNVSKENLSDYAITVHGIKSSSRGICAETAGDTAEALEKAAKDGNLDFVLSNNAAFIESIEKCIHALNDMLGKIAAESSKPKKDKPDRFVLNKLLEACKAYNMDGVDSAMTELESCNYDSGKELVTWLGENVEKMNFAEIIKKLSTLTGGMEVQG